MSVAWYSLDRDLHTVNHESITVAQANEIIDRYFANLQPHYEWGEDALAATMFGFQRPDSSYMQICIHSIDQIDVEYDFSLIRNPLLRLVGGRNQRHERVMSPQSLKARTKLFFEHSREEFQRLLREERAVGPEVA
jgi:hypothetical protein